MRVNSMIDAAFRLRFAGFTLDAACVLPSRGVSVFFGPSGCGKTSMLRCFAGLSKPEAGHLSVDGEIWQDATQFLPTHRRPVGYVFQEASLFSHLAVDGNLRFGLRRAVGTQRDIGYDDVVSLLSLEKLLARSPKNLSGGERQRVAIGRALLSQPRLLLMDEPMASLDRQNKQEILPYLERLAASLSLPIIYVTHDLTEMLRLADHLVLLDAGRVTAAGPLSELLSRLDLPMAQATDTASILPAEITSQDAEFGLAMLAVAGGVLSIPGAGFSIGERTRIRVNASDVALSLARPVDTTVLNILPAVVDAAETYQSHQTTVRLRLGADGLGETLLVRITRKSWESLGLKIGDSVFAMIKAVSLV